jgi:hypothetical protein
MPATDTGRNHYARRVATISRCGVNERLPPHLDRHRSRQFKQVFATANLTMRRFVSGNR